MKRRVIVSIAVLLLCAAGVAAAQQTQPSPPPAQAAPAQPEPAPPPKAEPAPPPKNEPAPPPKTEPAPPATGDVTAEVKAAKGVENREPVEEGTEFAAGDTVWAWSKITGAKGTTVKHVWKRDGKAEWSAKLKVGGNVWTTYSRRKVRAGSYTVEVVAADDSVIGSVDFTVQ